MTSLERPCTTSANYWGQSRFSAVSVAAKEGMPSFMYPQPSDQETLRVAEIEEVTQKGES